MKEIEDMLSLVRGKWKLRSDRLPAIGSSCHKYRYVIEPADNPFSDPAVVGYRGSKWATLAELLENWRRDGIHMRLECPASSAEELRMKLAVQGDQT